MMMGDIERLLAIPRPPLVAGADDGIRVIGLGLAGRRDEARQAVVAMQRQPRIPAFDAWIGFLTAWINRQPADMHASLSTFADYKIQHDPEANFIEGWLLCDVGEYDAALEFLRRAITSGYFVSPTLSSRHFDPLRNDRAFTDLVEQAEAGRREALRAFREAGGERLLGAAV